VTRLSVAIPLFNEQEVLPELLRRVGAVLDGIPDGPHEIVIVDDGSSDRTPALLDAAANVNPRLVVVTLSRNFGHQAALTAALDHASGDAVVLMDGDLQDPPEAIPSLLAQLAAGYDVVYAQRMQRKESWPLRVSYFLFYRLLYWLADLRLPLDAGDFGLMSRRVVDQIKAAPEHNRYLRGLRVWAGYKHIGVPIERDARFAGKSKYSTLKLLRLASDGIFAFSIVPLRAAAVVGAIAITLSIVFALYALYAKVVLDRSPAGFTAITILVTFLSGVNILFVGVIGEYVGRIYEEVKARPVYVVERLKRGP
jgi:glycosyltransferase involved in cell wall biosynthesis